jgi:hypothetical protein
MAEARQTHRYIGDGWCCEVSLDRIARKVMVANPGHDDDDRQGRYQKIVNRVRSPGRTKRQEGDG